MQVIKRNGDKEDLDINKIHKILTWACEGIENVYLSAIEANSKIQFKEKIKTTDIHNILIKSAVDLITIDTPNYQYVASRLLNYSLRKEVFDDHELPHLRKVIKRNVRRKVYERGLLKLYSEDEINDLNGYIDHNRDFTLTYSGIKQVMDKYLVQDRKSGQIFETPQFAYMLVSMCMFVNYKDIYDEKTRMKYVKEYYDAISTFKINIPTPIIAGVRTPIKQYSSCCLIDVGDDLDSIFSSVHAVGRYTARRSGIGVNVGRIRALGSKIRGGEVIHTGIIPFLKVFSAAVKSCSQNGIRGGSATVHFPIWHKEVKDLLVLKNNKGIEENRIRTMDYSIQISKLFYDRALKDKDMVLFSPGDFPELYDAWGTNKFDKVYKECERSASQKYLKENSINARELLMDVAKERLETGRIYIQHIDHANTHSSFRDKITMSNLCQEINLVSSPITGIDKEDDGEIALCILSAINFGIIELSEMEKLCDLTVRALDELIDIQDYPVLAAERSAINRRSLGIGIIGLADLLAKNKLKYTDEKALYLVDEWAESLSYNCIKASMELAKVKGKCGWNDRTKYSKGILPIHTYKKDVDELCDRKLSYDWDKLSEDIKETGIRNSTLLAMMPSESSSCVSSASNGIEPLRSLHTVKVSKKGNLPCIAKYIDEYKDYYQKAWDLDYDNLGYIKITALIQKYADQGMSLNMYSNRKRYPDGKIKVQDVLKDMMLCYKYGHKQMYYQNTEDGSGEQEEELEETKNPNSKPTQKQIEEKQKIKTQTIIEQDCESGACAI